MKTKVNIGLNILRLSLKNLSLIFSALFFISWPSLLWADYQFTELLPAGWSSAYAEDINNNRDVVGGGTKDGITKGFIYSNGNYIELLPPDWTWASAAGTNDVGDVVGYGVKEGTTYDRGFIYSGGTYTELLPLGWNWIETGGINNYGIVVGSCNDGTNNKAFIYNGGTYTTLIPPGWSQAYGYSINNKGDVIGDGLLPGDSHPKGFLYSKGMYTTLLPPGNIVSYAWGINDNGVVVGSCFDGNNVKGFLYSGGTYTILQPQGCIDLIPRQINNRGVVVGDCYDGTTSKVFIYDGDFTYINLLPLGWKQTNANDINDEGVVVGYGNDSNWVQKGFIATKSSKVSRLIISTQSMNVQNAGETLLISTTNGGYTNVAWSPAGNKIAYYDGFTYLINADGTGNNVLSETRGYYPAWNPSGDKLFLVCYNMCFETHYLWMINTDGTDEKEIVPVPGFWPWLISPNWSPTGNKLSFAGVLETSLSWDIFTLNVDGTELTNITNTTGYTWWETFHSWSPDGTKIAFATGDGQGIWVMNSDGTGRVQINSDYYTRGPIAWSPDGTKIAYSTYKSGKYDIWVMNADGSNQMQLTSTPNDEEYYISWSPDMNKIVFDRVSNGIWIMNLTYSLPPADVGASYNYNIAALGGTPPYTYSILSGNLPSGLTLNGSTGVISGTPTTAGTYSFNVQVKDVALNTATANLMIEVRPPVQVCNPPKDVYADNSKAFGLFEGIVENMIFDDKTTADFNIQATELIDLPFLKPRGVQFWVSIDEISFDPSIITVEPNETDEIGAFFAGQRLIALGTHASFRTSFCKPGTITFELGFSETAIGLTVADALLSIIPGVGSIPYNKILSFADDINDIPLVASSISHISNAINAALNKKRGKALNELRLARSDLIKLAFDKIQREQLLQAYKDLGVDITVKGLFKALLGAPARVFEIFADVIVLAIQTDFGTAGTIQIEVVAN